MAEDVNASIGIDIDASQAIAAIRQLSAEISAFHQLHSKRGAAVAKDLAAQTQNLTNLVNRTGAYRASMVNVASATSSFTTALEKNKLAMGETMRYAMGSMRPFSRMFKSEWEMVNKVARERVKDLQTQYIRLGRDANGALQAVKIRPLTLDMDNLQTKTMLAAQRMQVLNKLVEHGSTQLLNWGKNTQWAGRQLMVGFTIPLTMLGVASAKTFMDMEKQIIKIQRVYGDFSTTVEETKKMTDSLKELSLEFTKWGVSVTDTLGLAADAAATGAMGADLINQVTNATKLAVLGNVSQAEALETTMSVTNAFGIATEDLAKKIDFLNAVENQSVTSIEDLTTAIPIAAPVVKQLGGSVEDLAFFMTAMKEGGIDAGEGANALKSGLASIINPTEKASEMLMQFGINIKGIVEANKGDVKGTVIEFAEALDKLDPLNRAQAIEQLFGKFQFSRISTLFQNVIKEGTQAQRVLELSQSSTEQLAVLSQRELAKVEESTTYKFEAAMQRFQASLAPVGEEFLKAVTPLLDFGTQLLEQFNKWDDGAKTFAVTFAAVLGGLGPVLLMTIGLVANGVANLIKLFQFFAKTMFGAGKSTDTLGMQTDYMTQNMLEAQAAASSLGQTHSNLTQVYTSEAAALRNLAGALEIAAASQRKMQATAPVVGRTKPAKGYASGTMSVKRYASGVVSVPGPKGKGDVVPAMLSPGEAIIPTDMAQKYAPLIKGIVADSIPGYAKSNIGKDFGHIGPGKGMKASDILSLPGINISASIRNQLEQLQRVLPGAMAQLKHSWGVAMDSVTNQSLANRRGASIDRVGSQFTGQDITSRYGEMAKLANVDINDSQLQRELKNYDKAMAKKIQDLKKAGITNIVDTEEQLKALPEEQRKVTRSLQKLDADVIKDIGKQNQRLVAVRNTALRTVRDIRIGEGLDQLQRQKIMADEEANKALGRGYTKDSGEKGRRVFKSNQAKSAGGFIVLDEPIDSYESTEPKGQRRKAKEPSSGRARRITQAEAYGAMTPAEKAKLTKARNTGNEKLVAQLFAAKRAEIRAVEESARIAEKDAAAAKRSEAARRGVETRRANAERRAAIAAEQEAKSRTLGARIGNAARNAGGRVKGFVTSGRGAGVGMAASMGLMMASGMGGPVGDIAGAVSGPMMMLSMLGPVLGSIPAPVTAVIVALGALAAVGIGLQQTFENAMKKAIEFTDTMGAGTKSMQRLAEFTGKVSDAQAKDKQRQDAISRIAAQGVKEPGIGEQFLQTEAGTAMVENIASNLKNIDMATIREQLYQQMATAIATGAIDTQAAKSIVMALGEKLQDPALAVEVNLRLAGVFGPNGEKLENAKFDILAQISQESLDQTTKTIDMMQSRVSDIGQMVQNDWYDPLTLGISQLFDYYGKFGEISGLTAGIATQTIQQQQDLLDSLDIEYEKRLRNAKASGQDTTQLTKEFEQSRQAIIDAQNQTRETAIAPYIEAVNKQSLKDPLGQDFGLLSGTGPLGGRFDLAAMGDTLNTQIAKTFEGDAVQSVLAEQAKNLIVGSELGTQQGQVREAQLKVLLSTGDVAPQAFVDLLTGLTGEEATKQNEFILDIVSNLGTADGGQILQIASMIKDPKKRTEFQLLFTGNEAQAQKYSDLFTKVADFGGTKAVEIVSKKSTKELDEMAKSYQLIDDLTSAGPITMQTLVNTDPKFKALEDQAEYFNSLPAADQKVFVTRYLTVLDTVSPAEATAWMAQQMGGTGVAFRRSEAGAPMFTEAEAMAAYAANQARQMMDAINAAGGNPAEDQPLPSGGGGGGAAKTPEEQLLEDLNSVLGKQQKALSIIAMQEEEINDKYDKRKEALAEIAAINAQIAEEQRSQLDLADALSSGDIAAAARAAQEMRAKAAEKAMSDQEKALEDARQAELARVTFNGLTRDQLENSIKDLERKIAELEYNMPQKQDTGGGGGGGGGVDYTAPEPTLEPGPSPTAEPTTPKLPLGQIPTSFIPDVGGPMLEKAPVAPTPHAGLTGEQYTQAMAAYEQATSQWQTQTYRVIDSLKISGSSFQTLGGNSDALRAKIIAMGGTVTSEGIVKINGLTTDLKTMSEQLKLIGPNVTKAAEDAANAVLSTGGTADAAERAANAARDAATGAADAAGAAGSEAQRALAASRVATGGMTIRAYEAAFGARAMGGLIIGPGTGTSDSIPTMLSNGEYVVRAASVAKIGVPALDAINAGKIPELTGANVSANRISINSGSTSINRNGSSADSASVYNYSVVVNAETNANPEEIAGAVMAKIKQVEGQRVRGVIR